MFMQSIAIRKPCQLACDLRKVYIVDSIVHEYAAISVVYPGSRVCRLQQGNGSSVRHVAPNGDILDRKACLNAPNSTMEGFSVVLVANSPQ